MIDDNYHPSDTDCGLSDSTPCKIKTTVIINIQYKRIEFKFLNRSLHVKR